MPNAFNYSNTANPTTLTGSVSAAAVTVQVVSTTGFPVVPYVLALDYGAATEELVVVTAAAGPVLTVVRGHAGTSAQDHSLGAAVRHVWHAGDATDFRTHEAATSDVHGITGGLVGATTTQTLTNKTLSSPTINSGALSGTFTGSPTFSGSVALSGGGSWGGSFTGAPNITGGPWFQRAATSSQAIGVRVTADSNPRLLITADGALAWGPGSTAGDLTLSRTGVGELTATAHARIVNPVLGDALSTRIAGDTGARWAVDSNGAFTWGSGTGAGDVQLYRNVSGQLGIGGGLAVTGDLTAANIGTGPWTSYVVNWTVSAGGAPVVGAGGVLEGDYTLTGKTCTARVGLLAGGATTWGGGQFRFSLPFTAAAAGNAAFAWWGAGGGLDATNAHYPAVARVQPGQAFAMLLSPTTATGGTPTEWNSTRPFAWGSGDSLSFTVTYEIA